MDLIWASTCRTPALYGCILVWIVVSLIVLLILCSFLQRATTYRPRSWMCLNMAKKNDLNCDIRAMWYEPYHNNTCSRDVGTLGVDYSSWRDWTVRATSTRRRRARDRSNRSHCPTHPWTWRPRRVATMCRYDTGDGATADITKLGNIPFICVHTWPRVFGSPVLTHAMNCFCTSL